MNEELEQLIQEVKSILPWLLAAGIVVAGYHGVRKYMADRRAAAAEAVANAYTTEELEDAVVEPLVSELEGQVSGKKIGLFGSSDWGDGEWMRTWEENCRNDGLTLAADPVICNNTPDDDGLARCEALGKALA